MFENLGFSDICLVNIENWDLKKSEIFKHPCFRYSPYCLNLEKCDLSFTPLAGICTENPQGGAHVKILTGMLALFFLGLKFGQILFFWVGKFFSYFSGFCKISAIFLGLTNFQLLFWVCQFLYHTLETFE